MPEPKPPVTITPATIYLISKIWVDPMENELSAALGYECFGFTPDKEEAEAMVTAAGFSEGGGWPIGKGERMPRLDMIEVSRVTLQQIESLTR